MGTIYKADIATPTVYGQKDIDGINNIAHLTGDEYIASRGVAGFIKSTDKGVTWGAPFALDIDIPFVGIWRMPNTVGGVTAGRLMATRDVINDDAIYVSDDEGLTWTRKTAAYSGYTGMPARRNSGFYQRTDALGSGIVYCYNCVDGANTNACINHSIDGGETWGALGWSSSYVRHAQAQFIDPEGRFCEVRFSDPIADRVYYQRYSTSTAYTFATISIMNGITDGSTTNANKKWCADYHFLDATVGIAYRTQLNEWAFRYFDPTIPSVISAPQFTSSTGGIIDDIYFCQAMSTMTGKWSVITHNTAGLWQLWTTDDMATWNVVFTRDETDINQGYMTNHMIVD